MSHQELNLVLLGIPLFTGAELFQFLKCALEPLHKLHHNVPPRCPLQHPDIIPAIWY